MSAKKALVTGCNGFVGGYLCDSLISDGYEVHGVDLQSKPKDEKVAYHALSLGDVTTVRGLFEAEAFGEVYHLAAVANPRQAKAEPALAFGTSASTAIALLEALRAVPAAKLLMVGSSEQYKRKAGDSVVYRENDEVDSDTIYGASKVVSEKIARSYASQFGLKVFMTRSFNHTGPGQSPAYVLSDFARQCALIKLGRQGPELVTGDIDVKRDFLDVRDVVAAYRGIILRGKPGATYNVASGKAVRLRDCVERMAAVLGIENIHIAIDQARLRPGEPREIIGDASSLRLDTGWQPIQDILKTVEEMALYWREMLEAGVA